MDKSLIRFNEAWCMRNIIGTTCLVVASFSCSVNQASCKSEREPGQVVEEGSLTVAGDYEFHSHPKMAWRLNLWDSGRYLYRRWLHGGLRVEHVGYWRIEFGRVVFEESSPVYSVAGEKGFLPVIADGEFALVSSSGESYCSRFNVPVGGEERIRPGTNYRQPFGDAYRQTEPWWIPWVDE